MLEIKIIDKIIKYPAHLNEGDGDSLAKIFTEKTHRENYCEEIFL